MGKRKLLIAASLLLLGAAILFATQLQNATSSASRGGFVTAKGARFFVQGRPFRFVGANVAVIYGNEERAQMPDTMREAARMGVSVVRIWASGESGEDDSPASGIARNDWLKLNPFRRGPDDWNEEAFKSLDRAIAEAARHNLRVQVCLTNWWRDTGGVVRYLRWAGAPDAADETKPFGINVERAMLFYTNERARSLYRAHVQRIVSRRNTVTGVLYRDDPTIMGYELMNEAQAVTGRYRERRAWIEEMSRYIKSLDPNHLVAPGTWGYRNSWERRAWLEDHSLAEVDYCDVHIYPRDDLDSYVDSTEALQKFIDNRAAASFSIRKPLVIGEFGMVPEGYAGVSQRDWYRAYFESVARAGLSGAMFWRWTPDERGDYNITYSTPKDEGVRAEIQRGTQLFQKLLYDWPPAPRLLDASRHLIPHQFAFARKADDEALKPVATALQDGTLYTFAPEQAIAGRFEKLGGGAGYVWGYGMGFFEYVVPPVESNRRVKKIIVRAHLQPVAPHDVPPSEVSTQVTLFVNGTNCGSQLVPVEGNGQAVVRQWQVDSWLVRLSASRAQPLRIRFAVTTDAQPPFGLNISNWPAGYDPHGAKPVEVEIKE
ncbi:MAG: cellulase family glycosylhydrolase [Pyrinomonadaceae bacterium]|nr:cellulase family glycosylhydrolase [Pyrinomonadaceae bacterium]